MRVRKDYVREIQKFTTSQYWSTGVRITAGVMIPTLIMVKMGWLAVGMPFLWGFIVRQHYRHARADSSSKEWYVGGNCTEFIFGVYHYPRAPSPGIALDGDYRV